MSITTPQGFLSITLDAHMHAHMLIFILSMYIPPSSSLPTSPAVVSPLSSEKAMYINHKEDKHFETYIL